MMYVLRCLMSILSSRTCRASFLNTCPHTFEVSSSDMATKLFCTISQDLMTFSNKRKTQSTGAIIFIQGLSISVHSPS